MKYLKNIPKGFMKVTRPDHPFTFDGPDMLLSDSSGLIAIFEIRENEEKNPGKLISRLINSVIAYPARTQMLLLHEEDKSPEKISKFDKQYFTRLIGPKDLRRARAILRDKKTDFIINDINNIQSRLFKTQAQIQQDNIGYIKRTGFKRKRIFNLDNLEDRAHYRDRFTDKEVSVRANIYRYQKHFFGAKRLSANTSAIVDLTPYFEFTINSQFSIDNGVPYFNHMARKALNLNEIPQARFDPWKPVRVASLFGWYIGNTNNFIELEERIPKFFRNR